MAGNEHYGSPAYGGEIHWQRLLTTRRTRKQIVKPEPGARNDLQESALRDPPPPGGPIS